MITRKYYRIAKRLIRYLIGLLSIYLLWLLFTRWFFLLRLHVRVWRNDNCHVTSSSPPFILCVFDETAQDLFESTSVAEFGYFEEETGRTVEKFLDERTVYVDVGAGLGYNALRAASNGHEVIAVEPRTQCVANMHRSIQLNTLRSAFHVLPYAISNETNDAIVMTEPFKIGGAYVASVDQAGRVMSAVSDARLARVRTMTLTDLLRPLAPHPLLLRIDVWSHFCHLMANFETAFRSVDIHALIVQLSFRHEIDANCVTDIWDRLERFGYYGHDFDGLSIRQLRHTTRQRWFMRTVWLPNGTVFRQ